MLVHDPRGYWFRQNDNHIVQRTRGVVAAPDGAKSSSR